ncbi:MAG: dTDP-glucose 4,6-dehydratase [Thermodesulfobacteriota bacterium]
MRRILVTGGAGFIGSNFVRYMRAGRPEDRLVVLDKLTYAGNLANLADLEEDPLFEFVRGDIRDRALLDGLFDAGGIDTVVHFAAESHVDRSILGPGEFIDTNVIGTFTLLEAARKGWPGPGDPGAEKTRFIHVSTDEVYGSLGPTGLFTETTPYRPNSPYSASKAASDHLVRAYHHTYGLNTITTNCSNNYGPYQFPEKLIPLMIINALKGERLPVYGDGLYVRDWLHVTDHCMALDVVLERGAPGQTYNIGGRSEWKNIDIVNLVCETIDGLVSRDEGLAGLYPFEGSRKDLIEFVKDRPGHDRRYAIDCSRIETELGWQNAGTFEQRIGETIDWYIKNRPWWERIISGEYLDYYDRQYSGRFSK